MMSRTKPAVAQKLGMPADLRQVDRRLNSLVFGDSVLLQVASTSSGRDCDTNRPQYLRRF